MGNGETILGVLYCGCDRYMYSVLPSYYMLATSGPRLLFRVAFFCGVASGRFTLGHLTIIKARSSGALHYFRAARDGELKTLSKANPLVGGRRGFDLLVRSRPQSSLSLGFSGAGGVRDLIWEKANPAWCWKQSCCGTFSRELYIVDWRDQKRRIEIGPANN